MKMKNYKLLETQDLNEIYFGITKNQSKGIRLISQYLIKLFEFLSVLKII